MRFFTPNVSSQRFAIVIYIVELEDAEANVARKEYNGRTMREVIGVVDLELEDFPHLQVKDIWVKDSGDRIGP